MNSVENEPNHNDLNHLLTKKSGEATSSSVHKVKVSDEQKKFVSNVHAENINKQKKMDKQSITPVGNHCIIKAKLAHSLIALPGGKERGHIEWIQLWKTSDRLKNSMPELMEGKYCNVNIQLLLAVGATPCYEENEGGADYLYFKVNAEQIEYLYDLI